MRYVAWLTLAAMTAVAVHPAFAGTANGVVQYRDKAYDRNGQTGQTPLRPVRGAIVEVVRESDGVVLGEGVTDDFGEFFFPVTSSGTAAVYLRAYAQSGEAGINAIVKDTPASGAVYTAASPAASLNTNNAMWLDLEISGTGAAPFNVLDCAVWAFQYLASIDADFPASPPRLNLYWRAGGTSGTYFTTSGNSVYIYGGATDPDEWDDDIVLHEIGHYVAQNFSEDDSPGGAHSITGHYDIRLTWSEGWATAFGAFVKSYAEAVRPGSYPDAEYYVDSQNLSSSWNFEIEGPSSPSLTRGADNEVAVAAVLWDAFDGTGSESFDTLAAGIAPVWAIVNGPMISASHVSLEDFSDGFRASYPGWQAAFSAVMEARGIQYAADVAEPDGSVAAAQTLVTGAASAVRTLYPAGDADWYSFPVEGGKSYAVETLNLGDGADTLLQVYAADGQTMLASNDDGGTGAGASKATVTAETGGVLYARITRYSAAGTSGVYGSYQAMASETTSTGGSGGGSARRSGGGGGGGGGGCLASSAAGSMSGLAVAFAALALVRLRKRLV